MREIFIFIVIASVRSTEVPAISDVGQPESFYTPTEDPQKDVQKHM